jgi:hypothetical protein
MAKDKCPQCGAEQNDAVPFCESCGLLWNEPVECELHPGTPAVALCVVCGQPVCPECRELASVRSLCPNPEHRRMLETWNILISPSSIFEAEMYRQNLSMNGIECNIFCLQDFIGAVDLAYERATVWVPQTDAARAMALLTNLQISSLDEDEQPPPL